LDIFAFGDQTFHGPYLLVSTLRSNSLKKIVMEQIISSPKELVLSFIKLINEEQFDEARNLAHDDMVFKGVLGSRDGADAYFNDMKNMKLKYKIIKAFEEGNDVCVLYDLNMSGLTIFGCGWYQVEQGKVTSLKVIFDSRPLLEQADKK
jgi:predicted SnoaL-like aldol condensation-catalyzing enzyme